jgi:ribonuclease Z
MPLCTQHRAGILQVNETKKDAMKIQLRPVAALFISALSAAGQAPHVAAAATPLKIVILGAGAGPPVNLQKYGPSILIEAGEEKLMFDCGRGAPIRLVEAGVGQNQVDKIFLTHLHSDHIISLPDMLLTGWAMRRTAPLSVWGPAGTKEMMSNMLKTFDFDIHTRRDVDEKFPAEGISVVATDIREGVVYEHNGVKVSAFLVNHGPVKPAFGYRLDAGGHSVAMSGDTAFSENLISHATGVDVLIHEVAPATLAEFMERGLTREQSQSIIDHHTSSAETGVVFSRVGPKLAVYAHGGRPPDVAEARKTYSGRLEIADDLMTILVGDKVEVQRPSLQRSH